MCAPDHIVILYAGSFYSQVSTVHLVIFHSVSFCLQISVMVSVI